MAVFNNQTVTVGAGDEFRLDAVYGVISISFQGATAVEIGTADTLTHYTGGIVINDSSIVAAAGETIIGDFTYRQPA